jgi:hypothetical protein
MATVTNKLIAVLNNARAFPTATILRWANRAERDIAIKSGCLRNNDTVSTATSTRTVPFSGHRVVAVEYVPASGSHRALLKIVPRLLGRMRLEGAEPRGFFQWGSKVGIEPLPGTTLYNLILHVDDYPATEMVSASDNSSIPADFEDLIVIYGQFMAALKERRWTRAVTLYSEYRRQLFERLYVEQNVPDSRAGLVIPEKSTGKVK